MTAAVETIAYAHEKPWHGLGVPVTNKLSAEQMLKAAKLDWTVSKREIYLADGQKLGAKVDDQYALVRDSDNMVLSMVGSGYKPVQPAEAIGFFKKFVEAGHMDMETAGSLHNGRYIWGLAKLNASFKVGKNDVTEGYLMLASPYVIGKALVAQFTGVRVVCWNTFSMALGQKINIKGAKAKAAGIFRMPHSLAFDDHAKEAAEATLGIAKENLKQFEEASQLLAKKRAKQEAVTEYFFEVLSMSQAEWTAKQVEARKKDQDVQDLPKLVKDFGKALTFAPGQDMETTRGTWYGAFNAVTYVADHEMGRSRDTRLRSAWFEGASNIKRRALELALQKAA